MCQPVPRCGSFVWDLRNELYHTVLLTSSSCFPLSSIYSSLPPVFIRLWSRCSQTDGVVYKPSGSMWSSVPAHSRGALWGPLQMLRMEDWRLFQGTTMFKPNGSLPMATLSTLLSIHSTKTGQHVLLKEEKSPALVLFEAGCTRLLPPPHQFISLDSMGALLILGRGSSSISY